MTRQEMIKQSLSENIIDKEQIRANAKSQQIKTRMYSSKWAISVVSCLLVLSVGLGVFYIFNQNLASRSNSYSSVKMFSDEKLLYFTDVRKDDKLFSYDPVSKEIKTVIDESVYEFYINDEYYFYSNKSGFYGQSRKTAEKYRIADSAYEINEYQNSIYFVDYRSEDIKNPQDDNNIIGQEKWVTVYQFDIDTRILNAIKNSHHLDDCLETSDNQNRYKDISIQNLAIIQDKIYYRNETTVYCLSLDEKKEEIIFTSAGQLIWLDLMEDKFYCIEAIEWSGSAPVEVEQDEGYFFNTVNLKGEKISSYKMSFDDYHRLEKHNMSFDSKSNSYITLRDNELIRFSFDNPKEYITIATVDKPQNMNAFNVITINEAIFISIYDPIANHGHESRMNNEDYYIMTESDEGNVITIIRNGIVVS